MTLRLARLVCWLCTLALVLAPLAAAYLLVDRDAWIALARGSLALPIQWYTVESAQWYGLWVLSALYLAIGYLGLVHLRRAFKSLASGSGFDETNSVSLRTFALLLMLQGVARPMHHALASVLLSLNHPPNERLLSIALGSRELNLLLAGLILWVLADLLVTGTRAAAENRQFV